MFIVDLICEKGHLFEDWYDNAAAFQAARRDGALSCPLCGSQDIEQRLAFRGIGTRAMSNSGAGSVSSATPAPRPAETPPAMPLEVQRALSRLLKLVRAHSEDVGDAFAARALAMHRGDEEPRPIHGHSTPEEEKQLVHEGVPFVKIPVPDIDQN